MLKQSIFSFHIKKNHLWQTLVGISLFLVVFDWLGLGTQFKQQLSFYPNQLLEFNVSLGSDLASGWNSLRKMHQSARKIQDLERKLAVAQANLSELDKLRQENQELRQLIENTDRKLTKTTISRPILSFAQPAIAVTGQSIIKEGAAVLVQQTLVGTISRVKESIAYVDLLWQGEASPVLGETESGVEGLIIGNGKQVILTQLPMEAEVKPGERVVTVGQEGLAPGLFVGTIRSIESGESSAVKQAVLEQYVSFYESKVVEVR
jgi:cell shape-determining protein MreC